MMRFLAGSALRKHDNAPGRAQHGRLRVLALALALIAALAPTAGRAQCVGDCDGKGTVTVDELVIMINLALGNGSASDCTAGDTDHNGAITVDEILQAVNNALSGCPIIPTSTPTQAENTPTFTATATPITSTPTPSETVPPGPLGTRHLVLGAGSTFTVVGLLGTAPLSLGKFLGQSNGQAEPAFMDLSAGAVDPATGGRAVDITASSEYFYVDASQFGLVLCIKPQLPIAPAGILSCDGGNDFSTVLTQDHHLGEVGVNGFTADQCATLGGHVETPYAVCSAGQIGATCSTDSDCDSSTGSADGMCQHVPSTCTQGNAGAPCQTDADCDTSAGAGDGGCGEPHPRVCNGPLLAGQAGSDTGPGELLIAPLNLPGFNLNTKGFPVELKIEQALPCGDEGVGDLITFALTTGISRAQILNFSDTLNKTVSYDAHGQNFSCSDWQNPNGPGVLALTAPALHTSPSGGDLITVFTFSSQ